MAQREAIRKIKKYLKILNEAGIKIEKAFLFGSYANNNMTDESDIDIMIVSQDFDVNNDVITGKVWNLTRSVDPRIEPYMVGKYKFENDDVSPLLQIVKKEGVLIE